MTIINLTPHPVVINGHTFPKCDNPPRLREVVESLGTLEGVQLFRKSYDVSSCELPPELEGVFYIVPVLIAQAFVGKRSDLLITHDPIRDDQGRIIGCRALASLG